MENIDEEKISLCALNMIFGFTPRVAKALIDALGSAKAVFDLGREDMRELLGPYSKYSDKIQDDALETARKELVSAASSGISFLGRSEEGYPEQLAECEDSPTGIYIRSATPLQSLGSGRDYVSIVGTRNVTPYGKDWCVKIVDTLARSGKKPVIVSGLAYGTDITAHQAALDCGLDTIGVMATGADFVYPTAHGRQARLMATQPGSALISDYPIGTKAVAINFIRRNRIIAGLSRATILIESKAHGGGMITARQAFSYNRDLFALPGRASDPYSAGCNYLIRSGMATPVISEKDLAESLGYSFKLSIDNLKAVVSERYKSSLSREKVENAVKIALLVKKRPGLSVEEIMEEASIDYVAVSELIALMETDGFLSVDLMQRCTVRKFF